MSGNRDTMASVQGCGVVGVGAAYTEGFQKEPSGVITEEDCGLSE